MTTLFLLCGLSIIAVFAEAIIKELHPEYAKWLVLAFALVCIASVIPGIKDSVSFLKSISSITENKYTGMILKALGITYLSSLACEICNSADGGHINTYIEMVSRVEIIILTIPLFQELLEMVLI